MSYLRGHRAALAALFACTCLGGAIGAALQYASRTEQHCVYDRDLGSCGDRFAGDVTVTGVAVGVALAAFVWVLGVGIACVWRRRRGSTSRRPQMRVTGPFPPR